MMTKKQLRLILISALVLALVLSGGSYANAFMTATDILAITAPTENIGSANATASQPDFTTVLTPVNDSVILRPNAAGDVLFIESQFPASGEHWDKVDETTADNDTTYVETNNANFKEDLYQIEDHSSQTAGGTINYVKVYMVGRVTVNATQLSGYIAIKTNGTEYTGSTENFTTAYAVYTAQWNLNPFTGSAWTWDEIDALQIGVGIQRPATGEFTRVTQEWAEVNFDAPPLTGTSPTGDLFTVDPATGYTGDLSVTVYLLNTDNLTKSYQALNMQLYLVGSVEATKTPNYRVLTLDNGAVSFYLDGGGSGNQTLSITGGDYTLYSRDIAEWQADYSITPEFYIEVTQR